MTTPNMSSITASLERSLQNFSLNHHHNHSHNHNSYSSSGSNSSGGGGSGMGAGGGSSSGLQENQHQLSNSTSETSYELNSHISLPYHWEQCLDLKSGELYYINWRTGMKAKEDPRTSATVWNGDFDEDSEDDASSYESEDSSEEESSSFSRKQCINKISSNIHSSNNNQSDERGNVLVVAGCKSCMMYFMVPKQGEDCPKCSGQLLHFDKSENASSP